MDADLPTDLRITAQRRLAACHGVPMTVTHKGDPTSGAIYLKINLLNGTAEVLTQVRDQGGALAWLSTSDGQPLPEKEADAYLSSQVAFDPDLWIVEVEDKQGRHWFPEPILN